MAKALFYFADVNITKRFRKIGKEDMLEDFWL